jgi:hypothetical protein
MTTTPSPSSHGRYRTEVGLGRMRPESQSATHTNKCQSRMSRVGFAALSRHDRQTTQRRFCRVVGLPKVGSIELSSQPFYGPMNHRACNHPRRSYLLYIDDQDKIVPDDKVFSRLSNDASLIVCYADETVMNSYAPAWLNGVGCWSVFHDAQQNIEHLETSGTLPPEFQPIRDRLFAEQQGNDGGDFTFDIPIELFAALGGIRYDHDIPGAGPTY